MASAAVRAELECSICLSIYKNPVTLKCGHSFCQDCIDRFLDTQEGSGGYSCPKCRKRSKTRPALQRNITLSNIAQQYPEKSGLFCTYCVDSPVSAMKSCLHCEAYLCDKHLRVHNKAPDHVLADPTTPLQTRKCSIHKEPIKYYCINDGSCICVSCRLAGEHQGHQVKTLDEASEKKKETLRNVLPKLQIKKEETEEIVQSLQKHRRKAEGKATCETRVTALFTDLRRRLEDLEKTVLREISGQAERVSLMSDMIQKLEIKKNKLSRKMRHIEELCNMTDPLTVLQESDKCDLCDTEDGDNEDRDRHDRLLHDGGDLDVAGIIHTGLSDIISEVNIHFLIEETADILLDVNTAHYKLHISDDGKTVSRSDRNQNRPETPERFQDNAQVLSSQSFSSGRHYWEVDVGGSDVWRVGMCYPSINRKGWQAGIGRDKKSWGLLKSHNQLFIRYNDNETPLTTNLSSNRVRISVDYEAGRISFYAVCDPVQHLHTFTTTFTEPLHAVLCVANGSIKICGNVVAGCVYLPESAAAQPLQLAPIGPFMCSRDRPPGLPSLTRSGRVPPIRGRNCRSHRGSWRRRELQSWAAGSRPLSPSPSHCESVVPKADITDEEGRPGDMSWEHTPGSIAAGRCRSVTADLGRSTDPGTTGGNQEI